MAEREQTKEETIARLVEEAAGEARREPEEGQPDRGKGQKKNRGIKGFFRKHRRMCVALIILLAVVVGAVIFFQSRVHAARQVMANLTTQATAMVERRNIEVTLSGSGTLRPADSYTITSLVTGDILEADFEEGDMVTEDTVLYQVDSSDASNSIEQAELSLEKSQRSYARAVESREDLQVKAPESGTIVTLEVEMGDEVRAGEVIATLRNDSLMSLTLPFAVDDAILFAEGQEAIVTLDNTFEQVSGLICDITAVDEVLSGNLLVRQVTIDVKNPGGISLGQAGTAMVGNAACVSGGTFTYKGETGVTAMMAGEVGSLWVKEGDFVAEDQVIVALTSDTLEDSIRDAENAVKNAEISLENQQDKLENYTITSPIAGTIIEKYFKAGDKMETGKTLCTVFDLSYLTMTLQIDELDISQIEVGQRVQVTAEAVKDKVYQGEVTKVNINGTTQNGVTSYPVTIRIDETQGLLPGMNVDAVIVVESREDVLSVPISAVARGNRVLVKTDASSSSGKKPDAGGRGQQAPEGYEYVTVTTGVSDADYIEIVEGLKEGDQVAYTPVQGSGMDSMMAMFNAMGGGEMGFSGGGRPVGGPGGGF